jgi:hypothetical protein
VPRRKRGKRSCSAPKPPRKAPAAQRWEARQAIVAARKPRIGARKAEEQAHKERRRRRSALLPRRKPPRRAAALQAEQEAHAANEAERVRREAAAQAEREALLAARRAGRKA